MFIVPYIAVCLRLSPFSQASHKIHLLSPFFSQGEITLASYPVVILKLWTKGNDSTQSEVENYRFVVKITLLQDYDSYKMNVQFLPFKFLLKKEVCLCFVFHGNKKEIPDARLFDGYIFLACHVSPYLSRKFQCQPSFPPLMEEKLGQIGPWQSTCSVIQTS